MRHPSRIYPEVGMHVGKLVFAQVMEFAPWHTFGRLSRSIGRLQRTHLQLPRTSSCAWPLAQLTTGRAWPGHRSLPGSTAGQLYHLGIAQRQSRHLADANGDAGLALSTASLTRLLIRVARRLYARTRWRRSGQHGLALDSNHHRSVSVGVPLGAVSDTKAAIKLHTLLDLRGAIPVFIFIRTQVARCQCVWTSCCRSGAFYVMDAATRLRAAVC